MSKYSELNLNEVVQNWAVDMNTSASQTSKKSVFQYATDLSRLKFIDGTPAFEVHAHHKNGYPKAEMLYEETYRNDTDCEQMFSMKLTRETESVGRIDLSNALVIDGKTKLRMRQLPPGVPDTVGFGNEINVLDIGSHEMRESLSWSGDTPVKVKGWSTVRATVTVTEKIQESHFKINTHIRGNVHCDIKHRKTGHYTSCDGDIVEILKEFADGTPGLTFSKKQAHFESRGYCSFRFGIDKQVFLEHVDDDADEDDHDDE